MEDNINPEHIENSINDEYDGKTKVRGYKIVCAKLGLVMCVYFLCRLLLVLVSAFIVSVFGRLDSTLFGLINGVIVIIFVYIIPLLFAAAIFRSFSEYKGNYRSLYKKPRRLARALGTFPATFGFGHGVALLTLLASYIITRYFDVGSYLDDLLRPTVVEPTTNLASVFTMIFLMVVIAPLFEEFLCRGIMYDALKPYGTGMAILISSILFGLMHGSLYMLFYTTAYGLALGYVRYATGSLFIVTILHAIVNSIGAGALLLVSLIELADEANRYINTLYIIFLLAVLIMIIVGVVVFIAKIPSIRKFKIENSWTQVGPWKKTAWFFVSIPVIIMIILALNELAGNLLLGFLFH